MAKENSRFGLNLFLQFVLSGALIRLGEVCRALGNDNAYAILAGTGYVFLISFAFGLLYGFFRILGIKSAELEGFYQTVPMGVLSGPPDAAAPQAKPAPAPAKDAPEGISWEALFSFKYLRVAGMLLIVSSIFSLAFNIQWDLMNKLIAASAGGVLLCAAAEWLKRSRRTSQASMASLLGFTLLQFSLTLLFKLCVERHAGGSWEDAQLWLGAKVFLTFAFAFTLGRYPSDFQPLLYGLVAYGSPLTLTFAGATISFHQGAGFVALMSAFLLGCALLGRRHELLALNAVLGNLYASSFLAGPGAGPDPRSLLALYCGLFVAQLGAGVRAQIKDPNRRLFLQQTHLVLAHVLVLGAISALRGRIPLLHEYLGAAFMAVSLASLCGYMALQRRGGGPACAETLFNLSVLIAAGGLFLQVRGPATAVIFLTYSCLLLWYSLYNPYFRTRLYAFVILTISLIKLYLECSEVFSSIPGSLAVLAIGMALLGLSYKFEALKDIVLKGVPRV